MTYGTDSYSSYYDAIRSNVIGAGRIWAGYLDPAADVSLEVSVGFANIPTANGGSVTSSFVRGDGTHTIFEQGAAAEIRTGIDPNGAGGDVRFNIGYDYLMNELWFDTDPVNRTGALPGDRTDAVSVFLHEFGHALGFNGWRDWLTGALPGNYMSPFDELVRTDGTDFYFTGSKAVEAYGGWVPLTYGNMMHVGNNAPRPGSELIGPPSSGGDLMNGVVFYRGSRYSISELDLAILADMGLPLRSAAVPEPASLAMAGLGGAFVLLVATRRGGREVA